MDLRLPKSVEQVRYEYYLLCYTLMFTSCRFVAFISALYIDIGCNLDNTLDWIAATSHRKRGRTSDYAIHNPVGVALHALINNTTDDRFYKLALSSGVNDVLR